MTTPGFIHLHVHSAYSLLEGALPVKALAKLAAADVQPALAITDRNNLFGALEFSEALAGEGIQPIIGCALNVAFPAAAEEASRPGARPAPHHGPIVLLAKDASGYANLMRLSSQAFLDHGENGAPHVTFAELEQCAGGLIALSGGPDGPVDRAFAAGNAAVAEARLDMLAGLFEGRFYVELQRHGFASANAWLSRSSFAGLTSTACLSLPQTKPIFRSGTLSKRTMRCFASRKAATSRRMTGGGYRRIIG